MIRGEWPKAIDRGVKWEHRETNIGTVEHPCMIMMDDIPRLIKDPEVHMAWNTWAHTKKWGLPFGGGWANNPAWILDMLDTMDELDAEYERATHNRAHR